MQIHFKGEMGRDEDASKPNRQVNILHVGLGANSTTLKTLIDAKHEGLLLG